MISINLLCVCPELLTVVLFSFGTVLTDDFGTEAGLLALELGLLLCDGPEVLQLFEELTLELVGLFEGSSTFFFLT